MRRNITSVFIGAWLFFCGIGLISAADDKFLCGCAVRNSSDSSDPILFERTTSLKFACNENGTLTCLHLCKALATMNPDADGILCRGIEVDAIVVRPHLFSNLCGTYSYTGVAQTHISTCCKNRRPMNCMEFWGFIPLK